MATGVLTLKWLPRCYTDLNGNQGSYTAQHGHQGIILANRLNCLKWPPGSYTAQNGRTGIYSAQNGHQEVTLL